MFPIHFALVASNCFIIVVCYSAALEKYRYVHESQGVEIVPCATMLIMEQHVGKPKGIQGHQNCYIDATIFGMFAFTDVFDWLLLKTNAMSKDRDEVRRILQQAIVNPLRK